MKIAIISPYTNTCPPLAYGGESYFWGLAKTLGEIGHEVHLFAPKGSLTPPNGFLHVIPNTEKGSIDYGIEVGIEKTYHDLFMACDVVHDCSLDHIVAERLRYLYGKREIINTINGRCYNMPRPPFNVITGSKAWQEDARSFGLNTEMIYWGIDTEFYTEGENKNNGREEWFLWIARFHPDKGLDLALDLAEFLGFELKVAGSTQFADHAEYGRKYIDRISQIKNVTYEELLLDSTHHERKRELYRKAYAFLYPVQYFECFGLVVAEAMACGCPVITTPNGAMPELVSDGNSGFICNSKNEFVTTIQKVLPRYNNSSRFHAGFNLRKHARTQAEKFSWRNASLEYEKLYQQVIEGKGW